MSGNVNDYPESIKRPFKSTWGELAPTL